VGKLIYTMNVSLDGYVESSDGGLDWTGVDDELHAWFTEELRLIEASLYGRRLYEDDGRVLADRARPDPARDGGHPQYARGL
jgi:dihydrofolate reductase